MTQVEQLSGDERVAELARMLGADTDAGRASVLEMMQDVEEAKKPLPNDRSGRSPIRCPCGSAPKHTGILSETGPLSFSDKLREKEPP